MQMLYAREIQTISNHDAILKSASELAKLKKSLDQGNVVVAKNVVSSQKLLQVRDYLVRVGQNSLPNYQKIEKGAPNFHRMNNLDPRSYVQACFHQFSFFPWNQDIFNLFDLAKNVYRMRNLLSGLPENKFQGSEVEDGCTARLSFQFYPQGCGEMNKHVDPYDFHQYVVPIVVMSKKGKDFSEGGAYVVNAEGKEIYLDDHADIGDVLYFNAQMPHGVARVDPRQTRNWSSFQGRWIMLTAVNRLAENTVVANSIDLGN